MAGRIRTIKPEILTDAVAAGLSHAAWRLWVSMWCLADDHGRLPAAPTLLAAQVFWAQTTPIDPLIAELTEAGLIETYVVRRQTFCRVLGWQKHQKIDRPSGAKFPGPDESDEGSRGLASLREPSRVPLDPLASTRDATETHSRGLDADHDHDHDHDLDLDLPRSRKPKARKTELPAEWSPTPEHEALAQTLGVLAEVEAAKFRDHAAANGRLAVRWHAAFSGWLRNAAEYRGGVRKNAATGKPERYHAVRDRTAYADPETERKEF